MRDGNAQLVLRFLQILPFAIIALVAPACRKPAVKAPASAPPVPWFQDATESAGLQFIQDVGALGNYGFPEIMGSGAALLDYDNDGRLDIYLVQNAGPNSGVTNRLYHQESDGHFRDVTAGSGLDISGRGMGVAIGDVNNDGWPDVLVTEYGGIRLFLNNGNGTFHEATKEAGLQLPQASGAILPWATSAAFADYDRDGWLDLIVTFYVAYDPARSCIGVDGKPDYCGPHDFPGSVTRLFHNNHGHFEDVTDASGIGSATTAGLGVICLFSEASSYPMFLVANDGRPNPALAESRRRHFSHDMPPIFVASPAGSDRPAAGQHGNRLG